MYLILIILGFIVFFYILNKVNDPTVFGFNENDLVLFDRKRVTIPFNKIKTIDRGIEGGESNGILHIRYYIVFENSKGEDEKVQFDRSSKERDLWEQFKLKLLAQNPTVTINESIV